MNKPTGRSLALLRLGLLVVGVIGSGIVLLVVGADNLSGALESASSSPIGVIGFIALYVACLLYTSPSPRDRQKARMPSSA